MIGIQLGEHRREYEEEDYKVDDEDVKMVVVSRMTGEQSKTNQGD